MIRLDSLNQLGAPAYTDLLWCYETPDIATSEEWKAASRQLEASFHHCINTKFGVFLNSRITRDAKDHKNRMVLDKLGKHPVEFKIGEDANGWIPTEDSLISGCTELWPLLQLSPRADTKKDSWLFREGVDPSIMAKVTWCHSMTQTTRKADIQRKSYVMVYLKCNHYTLDGLSAVCILHEWATTHRVQPHYQRSPTTQEEKSCTSKGDNTPLCVDQTLNVAKKSEGGGKSKAPIPPGYQTFCPLWIFSFLMNYTPMLNSKDLTYLKLRFPKSVLETMQADANATLRKMDIAGSSSLQLTKNDILCAAIWKAHFDSDYELAKLKAQGSKSLVGLALASVSTKLGTWWTTPKVKPTSNCMGVDVRKVRGLVDDQAARGARNTFIGNAVVTSYSRVEGMPERSLLSVAVQFHKEVRASLTKEAVESVLQWEEERTTHVYPGLVFGARKDEVPQVVSAWRHMPFYDDATVFGGHFMGNAKPRVAVAADPKPGCVMLPPPPAAANCDGDWDVCQTVRPGGKAGFLGKLPPGVQVLGLVRPLTKEATAMPRKRGLPAYARIILEIALVWSLCFLFEYPRLGWGLAILMALIR